MKKWLPSGYSGIRVAVFASALAVVCGSLVATAAQLSPTHRSRDKLSAAAAATVASTSNQEVLDPEDARFFLTRTGFAPDNAELAQYIGLTREQAVDRILANTRTEAVTPLPEWASEPIPTRDTRRGWSVDERHAEQRLRTQRYEQLRAWWVREMLVTPSPLTERMTLFWHNHFTSGQDKVAYPQLMAQQNRLLRRDALGRFGELLHDVAKDPAMLQYLDGAGNRKGKPNENFAREVMELFTLGEGNYTQRDVSEAARAYTGWSLDADTQAYVWRANQHDDGEKTVLGRTGPFDGDQMLDILLDQPETATFVTTRLWREFVSDTPDAAAIAPIAERFRASHDDVRVALRALFLSNAFWDEDNRGVLVKSPVEFVVGTLREFDVDYDDTAPFAAQIRTLGENLFYPPNVKGWPGGTTWINSSTLLARKQFVERLFRATEAPGKMTMQTAQPVMASNATDATRILTNQLRPVRRGGVHFDIDTWLSQYRLAPMTKPGLSAELQLQHAVLPLAPVDAIETGASANAYLQALLMDPAYQLK
ncbi:DUF1800 family protein [Paraburkholderia sp. BCC1886]|uniref:DUF1800 domain-containing protein n=1 Tax=Paraburkholderia sp. BCC1886 TaxID=2562670 RepID=UPI001183D3D1|nr:DUF1800 domain-containing protein [Paraburkholderia sp. BCC1886]